MKRFTRAGDGMDVRLHEREAEVLRNLLDGLGTVIAANEDDPARERLFPAAYREDPLAEEQWRSITRDDLTSERTRALEAVGASLRRARSNKGFAEVRLDADEVHAWMTVVNDARLVLGVRLGVEEEWVTSPPDLDDATRGAYEVYAYLGWLLSDLLDALDSTLGDIEPQPGAAD